MRAQKTIKKLLRNLEDPKKIAEVVFNEDEIWGIKYALKWVMNYDLSELMKEVDARFLKRRKKMKDKKVRAIKYEMVCPKHGKVINFVSGFYPKERIDCPVNGCTFRRYI